MISLIVVEYKSIERTLNYIKHFLDSVTYDDMLHVIIVDNYNETNHNIQFLESKVEDFRVSEYDILREKKVFIGTIEGVELLYLCANENLGYARGNNLGALLSFEYYKDAYYIFSNNDLTFPRLFDLNVLIMPMILNEKVAAVGPRIVDINGVQQSPRRKVSAINKLFLSYFDLLLPLKLKLQILSDVIITNSNGTYDWVSGSFFVVDAVKFNEVDRFDNHTFLYFEESILSERFRLHGYSMYYIDELILVHDHSKTVNQTAGVLNGLRISFESAIYYYERYRSLGKVFVAMARIHFELFYLLFRLKKSIGIYLSKIKEKNN